MVFASTTRKVILRTLACLRVYYFNSQVDRIKGCEATLIAS